MIVNLKTLLQILFVPFDKIKYKVYISDQVNRRLM